MKERWAFSQAELEAPAKCRGDDELLAYVDYDDGYGRTEGVDIVVYRNGEVSNRFGDGTAGVMKELAELAGCQETLLHSDGDYTEGWKDVETDADGNFVRFID